jgi:Rrf2 family protein
MVLAARPAGATLTLAQIAEAKNLPTTFLAKIFQKLARHGLVASSRGPGRGYALARSSSSITIHEILESVEGPRLNQRCLLWNRRCADEQPCPLHHHVRVLLPKLDWILQHITLAEYTEELAGLEGPAPQTASSEIPRVSPTTERNSIDRPANRRSTGHAAIPSPFPLHATIPISAHLGAKR